MNYYPHHIGDCITAATYSGRQELRSFVQEIANLYAFLGPRNDTARNPWVVDARSPMLRHELRRRGNTELYPYGRWQSIDTQSFHALRSNRWIGCYFREYPMAWGWIPTAAAQSVGSPHVDDPPDDFAAQDFWRWVRDATNWDIHFGDANPLANSRAVANRQRWQGVAFRVISIHGRAPRFVACGLPLTCVIQAQRVSY